MQHPVGYKIVDGEAQLTSVWALLSNGFALRAYVHTMLAGLIFGSIVMLGVCCWHFLRGREVDLFRKAAKLALIVAVPVTLLQLVVGNRFGEAVTSAQSMKIAASEAQWNTCQPCGFSLFQIGGFTAERPDAELLDHDPEAPLVHGHRLVRRPGAGPQPAAGAGADASTAPATTCRTCGSIYWSMRVMAFAGVLMFLVAAVGAWLYRKQKLERARWFLWTAIVAIALPVHRRDRRLDPDRDGTPALDRAGAAADQRGELAERQHDLARDQPRRSSSRLYLVLGVVDFVLMRRYARLDRPTPTARTAVARRRPR